MIQLEQVNFSYPGHSRPVLSEINLVLREGERICLAGGNGSGKTTLALMLAGLLAPSSGQIRVNGEPVQKIPHGLAALAFQNPDDQMVASIVEKEIAFGLELRNCPQAEMEQAIGRVLSLFSATHLGRRKIETLSGGEKQKVAIGSLVVAHPQMLILDEPDSFLDLAGKEALESALATLRTERPNLIEVRIAQELETMRQYDRLIVLNEGSIIADDKADTILSDTAKLTDTKLVVTPHIANSTALGRARVDVASPVTMEARHLTFSYDNQRLLLDDFSFTMKTGEIVGISGATGSGKSTLGLLLCDLLTPTTGSISFSGPSSIPNRRMITMALQQPERQFFLATCATEIAFGPKSQNNLLSEAQINELFGMVGLAADKFADRDPLTLSVGEQRRLAFAVMLALGCPFMIFDEPTAGLDAAGVASFDLLIRQLAKSGKGVIVISHDHGLLDRLSTRRIELSSKQISTKC